MGSPAVAAAAALVLTAKLLAFAHEAVRARSWWHAKLHATIRCLRSVIDRLRHAFREDPPCTEFDEAVRSRMAVLRRMGSRFAVTLLNCIFAVVLLGIVLDNLGGDASMTRPLQQQVFSITVSALFSIPQCLPYLHGRLCFSHAVYAFLTVSSLVLFSLGSFEYGLVAAFSLQMAFFMLHLGSLRIWVSMFWQSILSTGLAVGLYRSSINPLLMEYVLRGLVLQWLAAVGIVGGIESGVRSMIQAEMESQGLQEKQAAFNTLLGTFYDVILELDPELRIASGAAELGTFLQCGTSSPRSIATLQEVLPSEEHRQLIDERLREESGGSTQVLHLHMQSEGGGGGGEAKAQAVELFSMSFPSMAGRRRHLVGIRAEGDGDTTGLEAGTEAAGAGVVSVLVSCEYKEMPIIECSEAFNRKMGPVGDGAMFHKLLDRRHRKGFQEWMDKIIDLQLEGRGEEAQSMSSLAVRLRPTGQQRACVMAVCQIDFNLSLKDTDRCQVFLLFQDWQLGFRIRQHVEVMGEDELGGGSSCRGTPRIIGGEQVGRLPLGL